MAEALARSSGTDDAVLQRVLGQDFLMSCLRKAKFSADLLQDTADACDINDLNALVLASGIMTVTEASEKLFLMQDEASTVVTVCRKECLRAGVNFGDGAKLTAAELAEVDDDGAPAPAPAAAPPAPAPPAVQAPPAPSQAAPAGKSAPAPTASPSPASAPAAPTATSTRPAAASASTPAGAASSQQRTGITSTSSAEHPDPNFLIKPPVAGSSAAPTASTSAATTPQSLRGHIPKPAAGTPATPAATATPRVASKPAVRASPSTATPQQGGAAHDSASKPGSMNGKHTATPAGPSSSAAKPPRPTSAPLTTRASLNGPLPKERPMSGLPTPSPSVKPPSYAKSTASHKARLLKEDSDAASTSVPSVPVTFASTNKPLRRFLYMPPRPTSATPEEKKEPKKPIFDNIRSSLLRPTAAFLAWSQGKGKQGKEADLRTSQKLQSEGGTTARAKPPAPPSAKSVSKSEAGAAAVSPGASAGGTKSASTTPFRLASAERHQKAQEELARKKEEKARLEANVPQFKASPMPGERSYSAAKSPKTGPSVQTEV